MLVNNGSWKGNFFAEDGSSEYEVHGAESEISVHHIPGGNRNVIQVGGRKSVEFALRIQCTGSDISSFRNQVGALGTLVYSGGTYTNVVLKSVNSVSQIISNYDRYRATLNFWV